MEGKYSIELFRDGVEGAGIEKILVRHDSLTVARALYKVAALNCSERLIMLCDKARVLARSDRSRDDAGNKKCSPCLQRPLITIRRASSTDCQFAPPRP
jgi:hypothetical protein